MSKYAERCELQFKIRSSSAQNDDDDGDSDNNAMNILHREESLSLHTPLKLFMPQHIKCSTFASVLVQHIHDAASFERSSMCVTVPMNTNRLLNSYKHEPIVCVCVISVRRCAGEECMCVPVVVCSVHGRVRV